MYKDINMYTLAEVAKTENNSYEEYFEFIVATEYEKLAVGASYGQIGVAHEEGKNLILLLETNDVLFIDVCEVDELFERMFEIEPEEEEEDDTGLFELIEMGEEM